MDDQTQQTTGQEFSEGLDSISQDSETQAETAVDRVEETAVEQEQVVNEEAHEEEAPKKKTKKEKKEKAEEAEEGCVLLTNVKHSGNLYKKGSVLKTDDEELVTLFRQKGFIK